MSQTQKKDDQCLADDLLGGAFDKNRPGVRPAMHPTVSRFLAQKELVFSLMDGLGSPLNVIFPDHINENIEKFEQVFKDRHLQGRIFYTSKPNKSAALKKRASLSSCGLDVSSEGELKAGLSAGFHPSRIEATGPKSPDYLFLGAQQDIILNIDNMSELHQLKAMHSRLPANRKIRILCRLDGFKPEHIKFTTQDSAFGIRVSEASALLDYLVAHQDIFDFIGFSFHFNAGDYIRRPPAIEKCLELTFEAINRGLSPKGLDIGGGYRIRYADSQDEWNNYVQALKEATLGERPSLTWNDSGLGFRNENGVLKGAPNFMEHWHKDDGPADFASIIDTPLVNFDNQSTAKILSESLLELYVEPGRAMLDHCGLTLAKVNLNKPSLEGEDLISLQMNRTNLNATQLKSMIDPVVICRNDKRERSEHGLLYVGNLCLTHDMIQYHKTFPNQKPQEGDVVAFINTAAYQMDFSETAVLRQNVADKVAVVETEENIFRWARDEFYNPLTIKKGAL
jgi:diaminopimelate decarboxylase